MNNLKTSIPSDLLSRHIKHSALNNVSEIVKICYLPFKMSDCFDFEAVFPHDRTNIFFELITACAFLKTLLQQDVSSCDVGVTHFLVSQMTQAQLETLQTDNHHLRGLLHRLESQSPRV